VTVLAWTIGRYGGNNNNDTITTLMQRREKKSFFDLYRQRHNTMKMQGCVMTTYTDNGDNNAREDWHWRGLEKGDLFVFRKTVCVALRKAVCFRF
jgi:hypothetical protein